MLNILNYLSSFLHNEEGQGMVEYALLIGLLAIASIVIVTALGTDIAAQFQTIIDKLNIPTT